MSERSDKAQQWQDMFERSGVGSWPEYLAVLGVDPPLPPPPPAGTTGTAVIQPTADVESRYGAKGIWAPHRNGELGFHCIMEFTGGGGLGFVPAHMVISFNPDIVVGYTEAVKVLHRIAHRKREAERDGGDINVTKRALQAYEESWDIVNNWLIKLGVDPEPGKGDPEW